MYSSPMFIKICFAKGFRKSCFLFDKITLLYGKAVISCEARLVLSNINKPIEKLKLLKQNFEEAYSG